MWESPVPCSPRGHSGTHGMDTMGEADFSSAKGRTQSHFNKGKNVPLQEEFKQRLHDHLTKTS